MLLSFDQAAFEELENRVRATANDPMIANFAKLWDDATGASVAEKAAVLAPQMQWNEANIANIISANPANGVAFANSLLEGSFDA